MMIETTGFKELERALRALPINAENRVLKNASMAAIRVARKAIKDATPKGVEQSPASKQYGRMSKNLKVKSLRQKYKGTRAAQVDTGDAFWAVFYEKGTRRQAARPFFTPAFERAEKDMIDAATEKMIAGIEREINRLL